MIRLFYFLFLCFPLMAEDLTNLELIRAEYTEYLDTDRAVILKASTLKAEAEKEALDFLLKGLTLHDSAMPLSSLEENVTYALKARQEFPWAKALPKALFFNDVLPHAQLDETRDRWRKGFYQRFAKMVQSCSTAKEAVYRINYAIKDEVKVIYSTKRKKPNQSVSESMEQGVASCTGLSILLANAFRSVGIPARIAGVPSWTKVRGNHNWVEVYIDGEWKFTEYYPDKELNKSWFLTRVADADLSKWYYKVYASSYEKRQQHFPMVWNIEDQLVPGVDVSARYVELAKKAGLKKVLAKDELELRIVFKKEGKRQAQWIRLYQGEKKLAEGETRSAEKDANDFLVFVVKRGQEYQLRYGDQKKIVEVVREGGSQLIAL